MHTIKTLIGISITSTILACCSNSKVREKANSLTQKWNIVELRTKDTVLKAPGLTIYHFLAGNSYTMTLQKADTVIKSYKGRYDFKAEKKLLLTDYTINGHAQHDEAQVILLNAAELQLVDINTKDTIVFKAYPK
jgi:hypothetical protein